MVKSGGCVLVVVVTCARVMKYSMCVCPVNICMNAAATKSLLNPRLNLNRVMMVVVGGGVCLGDKRERRAVESGVCDFGI